MKRSKVWFANSIKTKIFVPLFLMVFLGVVVLGSVYLMVNEQKADNLYFDEASHLPTLSQRMAKAAFLLAAGEETGREELRVTAQRFDETLSAVRFGDTEKGIPSPPDELTPQLDLVVDLWMDFQGSVEQLTGADTDSLTFRNAVADIADRNTTLLTEANSTVTLFKEIAGRRITNLYTILLTILVLGAVLFFAVIIIVRRAIQPIGELADASERVAQGDVTVSVRITSKDELGQLGSAFNRMLGKIRRNVSDMKHFIDLMVRTNEEDDIDRALHIFLEKAQQTTQATYAALTVLSPEGTIDKFLTLGIPKEVKHRIGRLPEGKGVLKYLQDTKEILRLDDMTQHPSSAGFPQGHPPMKSLLAVPILYGDYAIGNLYLADKQGTDAFDEDDEQIIINAALLVGIMIKEKETSQENERGRLYLQEETNNLVSVMDRLAMGDFTVQIDTTNHGDDISRLKMRLNDMVMGLRDLIGQVRQAVDATTFAVSQISDSTEQLAAGSQQQAAQAGEVAAAVEEMAATIVENASNANRTAELALQNGQAAKDGGQVIKQTVEKIGDIAEVVGTSAHTVERLGVSSSEIGEIASVIDEIADQTNLLALNA
ncbi:MAG: HAMP domain-containing protein, partial [Rhodothermales bacterium]